MKSEVKQVGILGCLTACIFVVMLTSTPVRGYSSEANFDRVAIKPETVTVIAGESTIVKAPWPTVRVSITDPKVADVKILTPDQALLQGIKAGSTDLILWGEDEKQIWQRRVLVRLDTARFKAKLDELFPHCSLQVSESGDVLIVKGLLRSTDEVTQLHGFLGKAGVTYVDMTSIAGVQQVQLQVRVAEVSRRALRALGVNAFHTDDDYFFGVRAGSASGGAIVPSIDIGVPEGTVAGDTTDFVFTQGVSVGSLVTIFGGIPRADFEVFLQALAENQYLRILANPTLVALSGEQADFLAGGEFPIPVVQGSGAGTGAGNAITIEFKEYGVRLSFRPLVLGDGTIRLHASQEVSELTTGVRAVVIQGYEVPALVTRKAETTLELKSGQTFAMAGLLQHTTGAQASRIPGLGDLPILGPLFRSVRYTEDETELVILVTASLVEPMSLSTTPPTPGCLHTAPNDWELYIEGRIEGREPARIDSTSAQWLKELGLDRLLGPGAWDSYGTQIPQSQGETPPEATDTEDSDAALREQRATEVL